MSHNAGPWRVFLADETDAELESLSKTARNYVKRKTVMEEEVFWSLLEQACQMGRFVAAVPNSAASANIVGELEPGRDGDERVVQKKNEPTSHIHFKPEGISEFAFTFVDPGFGPEPCLELRTREGAPALRLYFQGVNADQRCEEFIERNLQHQALISGSWSEPSAGSNQGIFV